MIHAKEETRHSNCLGHNKTGDYSLAPLFPNSRLSTDIISPSWTWQLFVNRIKKTVIKVFTQELGGTQGQGKTMPLAFSFNIVP
jgi:hypothetical protein